MSIFDTHCHLNFSRFKKNVDEVIDQARACDVTHIVVPGTDLTSSQKAIEIANTHDNIYAAVGIHPHHVFENHDEESYRLLLASIESLLSQPKCVAIGEVGLDRHVHDETKYKNYHIGEQFMTDQKKYLGDQMKLAIGYNKSLILHNREAPEDLLEVLNNMWATALQSRTVFHCCEPNEMLLRFAIEHRVFIGVDGDITYGDKKVDFIRKIPPELLIVETDSPFLLPEPLRTLKQYPNEPKNITLTIEKLAFILSKKSRALKAQLFENSMQLFNLSA